MLLPVVLTLIANQNYQGGILKIIENMCYTKWALEAFVIANAERYGKTTPSPSLVIYFVGLINVYHKLGEKIHPNRTIK